MSSVDNISTTATTATAAAPAPALAAVNNGNKFSIEAFINELYNSKPSWPVEEKDRVIKVLRDLRYEDIEDFEHVDPIAFAKEHGVPEIVIVKLKTRAKQPAPVLRGGAPISSIVVPARGSHYRKSSDLVTPSPLSRTESDIFKEEMIWSTIDADKAPHEL